MFTSRLEREVSRAEKALDELQTALGTLLVLSHYEGALPSTATITLMRCPRERLTKPRRLRDDNPLIIIEGVELPRSRRLTPELTVLCVKHRRELRELKNSVRQLIALANRESEAARDAERARNDQHDELARCRRLAHVETVGQLLTADERPHRGAR